jgi:hypothetical protein
MRERIRMFHNNQNVPVLDSTQIMSLRGIYDSLPRLTAIAGADRKQSPEMRLAILYAWIDLRAQEVWFGRDWALSPDQVRLMMRCTLAQVGFVNRGRLQGQTLIIKDHTGQCLSLLDRIEPVLEHLAHCIHHGVTAPHHALMAARILHIYKLFLTDGQPKLHCDRMHESVMAFLYSPRRTEMDQHLKDGKDFLLNNCVDWLDPEDLKELDPDYIAAWHESQRRADHAHAPQDPPFAIGKSL